MVNLVFSGLKTHLSEKLEGFKFVSVSQVLEKALVKNQTNEIKDMY
jgi:hypothetical protein